MSSVQEILNLLHEAGARLSIVGSGLSPNAIGFSDKAMLNMVEMGSVLSVDTVKQQVRVEAGARVADVVEALRPHGLTLQNFASVSEQQIGGFLQVGAHGTGARIPPVDEQIVSFMLHTPGAGLISVSAERYPRLFHLARVGLGWLGVVSEVTIQCVPAHKLCQHTFVETREGVRRRHVELLAHQHVRYMWIPHTDTVVVVTCDPVAEDAKAPTQGEPAYVVGYKQLGLEPPAMPAAAAERPLRRLLLKTAEAMGAPVERAAVDGMSFAQLRDALLALAPLDKAHVVEVNKAEAAFWRASEGYKVDWSDKVLGFECGGQQWVSEVALPAGTASSPDFKDLDYMAELLALIEATDLATPAPIEQRWTRRSASRMSPAHSNRGTEDDLYSWVGIIMYLPSDDDAKRAAITRKFWEYNRLCREKLWPKYNCHQHWAKIEPPETPADLETMRARLRERYPLNELWAAKQRLDPKGVLGSTLVDTLLKPDPPFPFTIENGKHTSTGRLAQEPGVSVIDPKDYPPDLPEVNALLKELSTLKVGRVVSAIAKQALAESKTEMKAEVKKTILASVFSGGSPPAENKGLLARLFGR